MALPPSNSSNSSARYPQRVSPLSRRKALLLLASPPPATDPKIILDQSVTLDTANLDRLRSYVWNSEETSYRNGTIAAQQRFEINLVSGALYWRKLESNGQPLAGRELEAERQRLADHLANPGPGYNWLSERDHLELLPQTHSIRYLGLQTLNGRPNHILVTAPLASTEHPLLRSFAYKLWIDQAELHWTRAEITTLRKVSWLLHQLPIGRLSYPYSTNVVNSGSLTPGAVTTIQLQRLPDGVWTLDTYDTRNGPNYRNLLRYYNYRRFTSESQLLPEVR